MGRSQQNTDVGTLSGLKVSAPSTGSNTSEQWQWSAGTLGSCWTEENVSSPRNRHIMSILVRFFLCYEIVIFI